MDLFGVGSFTGKGIYDVDAFEAATGRTFPENHILSHDLIEGNYARCGLVSDTELFDDFPARYHAYARREHRWVRGDWQLLPWLGRRVPTARGWRANPLPLLERWKLFDNLRRSLVPPGRCSLLLVLGWTVLPGSPWLWTAAALATLAVPLFQSLLGSVVDSVRGRSFVGRCSTGPRSVPAVVGQVVARRRRFWPIAACFLLDAIGRTLVRYVLDAAQAAGMGDRRVDRAPPARADCCTVFADMWMAPALAVAIGAVVHLRSTGARCRRPLRFWPPGCCHRLSPFGSASRGGRPEIALTEAERRALRRIARKTWHFFDDLRRRRRPLASSGQLSGGSRRPGRPPDVADQHGALARLDPGRPRPGLHQPGRPPRAARAHLRHVRPAGKALGTLLQLVRHADAAAARAAVPLDGGQRQPAGVAW